MGLYKGNLYEIDFINVHGLDAIDLVQASNTNNSFQLWHHQLGHLIVKDTCALQSIVSGLDLNK